MLYTFILLPTIFFVSSHLFFFFPPHKATWSRRMVANCPFRAVLVCFGWNWTDFVVLVEIRPILLFRLLFPSESGWIGKNWKKKTANRSVGRHIRMSPVEVRRPWSHTYAFLIKTLMLISLTNYISVFLEIILHILIHPWHFYIFT